jgi:alpha-glucosidase
MKTIVRIWLTPILHLILAHHLIGSEITLFSPDSNLQLIVLTTDNSQLKYELKYMDQPVVQPSSMGVTVDGLNLGEGVVVGDENRYDGDETYAWRGVHSTAVNHFQGTKVAITHKKSGTKYTIELRAFDDGIAFRYIIPGQARRVVNGESTKFVLPARSTVWHHDFHMHYEGIHSKSDVAEIKPETWVAPPLTVKLPHDLGYAAISEAALVNFSGMGLQADGRNGFEARLGHEQPVSYPYELRYDDAERLKAPAALAGNIQTPWRVILVGPDLNTLVNSDIVHNLTLPPDATLFPNGFDTEWLKPGRAVWGYLTDAPRTLEGMKEMSRLAGELGFEYHVVEGHWQRWPFEQQKELIDYSLEHGVKILLWKHSRDLRDPEQRRAFFDQCRDLGAAGAKLDFYDHEAKEIIDLYYACLKEAAQRKLVVDFHGANKPTGESRTWPNELTREAIRGFEGRGPWAKHNATLPFTRMLAGHADYTPMHFGDRRCETSEAHQVATAIIFTSPLLIYAAHPRDILAHPAVELIKQIPSVWDETIALPCSEIGKVAAFARRTGDKWFIAMMNGETARHVKVDLTFLEDGDYNATFIRDKKGDSSMVSLIRKRETFGPRPGVIIDEAIANNRDGLVVELTAGGGFVALMSK